MTTRQVATVITVSYQKTKAKYYVLVSLSKTSFVLVSLIFALSSSGQKWNFPPSSPALRGLTSISWPSRWGSSLKAEGKFLRVHHITSKAVASLRMFWGTSPARTMSCCGFCTCERRASGKCPPPIFQCWCGISQKIA